MLNRFTFSSRAFCFVILLRIVWCFTPPTPFVLYQSIEASEIRLLVWPECLMLYSFISYFVVFRYTSSLSLCWELTSALLNGSAVSSLRDSFFPFYTSLTNLRNKCLLPSIPLHHVYFLLLVICHANSGQAEVFWPFILYHAVAAFYSYICISLLLGQNLTFCWCSLL